VDETTNLKSLLYLRKEEETPTAKALIIYSWGTDAKKKNSEIAEKVDDLVILGKRDSWLIWWGKPSHSSGRQEEGPGGGGKKNPLYAREKKASSPEEAERRNRPPCSLKEGHTNGEKQKKKALLL